MRRFLLVVLLAAAVTVAASFPSSTSAVAYRSCAPVRDIGPTGSDPADGVRIRAFRTSCRTARRVVKASTRAFVRHFDQETVRVRRNWRCTNTHPRVRCWTRGGKRIRFRNDG